MAHDPSLYFERHVARLLIVLYYCGQPSASLLDGETRQIESLSQLQRFDFWVREPGHLALALMDIASASRDGAAIDKPLLRVALDRMLNDCLVDTRRVPLAGAPYNIFEDFDQRLSFLTSRALVSDRPSFTRSRTAAHRVVLETRGADVVKEILDTCPAYVWYRLQCETVAAFFPALEQYDLSAMTYLAPDLTPLSATTTSLIPTIQRHYQKLFGENGHVDV